MQAIKLAFFALFGCASSIAFAAAPQASELSNLSLTQLNSKIADAQRNAKSDPRAFCALEPLLRELDRRDPNSLTRAGAEYDAAICSITAGDSAAMWRYLKVAEDLLPIEEGGNLRIAIESLALDMSASTRDADRYIAHVVHVAKMDDPGVFDVVDAEKLFANLSLLPEASADPVYLAFAEARNFRALPGYFRQAIGRDAVLPALRAGKREVALRMISEVSDVDYVFPLLLDRRYAALWPEIDERVGQHQSRVASDFVAFSKEEWAAEPNNHWAFGDLVRSLVGAGRNQEAIAAYQLMPKAPDSIAQYQPGDGWAINAVVVAFDREGRRAEADQAFDQLLQVSAEANPWVVGLLNKRAGRLIDQGRWKEAIVAATYGLESAERYGTANDQATAAAYVICASAHVPSDPVETRANRTIDMSGDKYPVAGAVAALCRGDKAKAKAMILSGLNNSKTRLLMIQNMQSASARPMPISYKSASVDLGDFAQSDDELTAEVMRYGRFLPANLFPAISIEGN